jgi:hypothetical protein
MFSTNPRLVDIWQKIRAREPVARGQEVRPNPER